MRERFASWKNYHVQIISVLHRACQQHMVSLFGTTCTEVMNRTAKTEKTFRTLPAESIC